MHRRQFLKASSAAAAAGTIFARTSNAIVGSGARRATPARAGDPENLHRPGSSAATGKRPLLPREHPDVYAETSRHQLSSRSVLL